MAGVSCPSCNLRIAFVHDLAGQMVTCPGCQAAFAMPIAGGSVPTPPEPPPIVEIPSFIPNSRPQASSYPRVDKKLFTRKNLKRAMLGVTLLWIAAMMGIFLLMFMSDLDPEMFKRGGRINYTTHSWETTSEALATNFIGSAVMGIACPTSLFAVTMVLLFVAKNACDD